MKTASRFATTLVLALLASTSHAALVDVGNGLINDPDANLTWVADANLFLTMATADSTLVAKVVTAWTDGPIPTLAGDGSTHIIIATDLDATTGRMNWYGARAWLNYLNVTHYLGYSDWRLPEIGTASLQPGGCAVCVPSDGFAVNSSEWWHLFFAELGGTEHVPIASSNNGSYSLFKNIEGDAYWGNAQNASTTAVFRDGGEQTSDQTSVVGYRAWAVRVGQSVTNPPLAPYIQFSPGNVVFDVTPYNTPSPTPGIITLINQGTGPATIASITTSGDFSQANNCGTSLAVAATCTVAVTFTPTDLFTRTGTLTVNADSVFTTSLTGTGGIGAGLSASPSTIKKGESFSLTWSVSPHAICQGVGGTPGWAGPLGPSSGTLLVTPADPGIYNYGISCTDDEHLLPDFQLRPVSVTVLNVASGALDWSLLLALTFALGLVLRARLRRDSTE